MDKIENKIKNLQELKWINKPKQKVLYWKIKYKNNVYYSHDRVDICQLYHKILFNVDDVEVSLETNDSEVLNYIKTVLSEDNLSLAYTPNNSKQMSIIDDLIFEMLCSIQDNFNNESRYDYDTKGVKINERYTIYCKYNRKSIINKLKCTLSLPPMQKQQYIEIIKCDNSVYLREFLSQQKYQIIHY